MEFNELDFFNNDDECESPKTLKEVFMLAVGSVIVFTLVYILFRFIND